MQRLSQALGAAFEGLGRGVVRRRGLALALVLATTALILGLAGLQLKRGGLPLDFTPQALFMDAGPEVAQVRQVAEIFGRDDNDIVFLVQGPLGTDAGVAALRALHATLAEPAQVERVESLITASTASAGDGALQVRLPFEELPPAAAVAAAVADPVLRGLLISADGDTTAVRARIDRNIDRVADLGPVVWDLVARAEAVPLPAGMRVLPTGVPYVRAEVVKLLLDSQLTYVPVVAAFFGITICLLFRRFWLGLAPLVCVLVADLWAMGLLVASGQVFNVLSVLAPTLVLVIGVADGIHITARYVEELARDGDREAALGRAMRAMVLPCFLTTFTTAAGFLSLLVADTAVMRAFGVQASLALAVTFLAVVVVLPTLLAFIPIHRVGRPENTQAPAEARLLAAVDGLVRRRSGAVLLACAALTAGALALGGSVRTNSRLLELYSEGMPTWEAIHIAEDELSGVIPVYLYVETDATDGLLDPAVLGAMGRVEQALRAQAPVLWTTSLASQVERLHGILTDQPGLPDSREAVAQELLVAEMAGRSMLDGMMDEDRRRGRVLVLMADAGGQVYLQVRRDIEAVARAELGGIPGLSWALTGDGFLAASGVDRLIGDLLGSLGLVFGVIFLMFWVMLRDAKLALVALVPNLVPLAFTLATLGLMGADLQTSNIVSFTVAVGLAVDDTIHFIARYQAERRLGKEVDAAMSATYAGAGHAIVLTSVLLVVGFSALATDVLTSTRHFGILTGVTMAAALLGDLFLLPALLHRVDGDKGPTPPCPLHSPAP